MKQNNRQGQTVEHISIQRAVTANRPFLNRLLEKELPEYAGPKSSVDNDINETDSCGVKVVLMQGTEVAAYKFYENSKGRKLPRELLTKAIKGCQNNSKEAKLEGFV